MGWLDVYENKVSDYLNELKFKAMPLLSWDAHMMNFSKTASFQKDAIQLKNIVNKLNVDVDVVEEFVANKAVIVITDTNLNIEFATNNMVEMSGYLPQEVVGNSPKMFQGIETDLKISKQIRNSVDKQESFEAVLKNYKKNSSVYNCHIKGFPVFDKKGTLVKYVAVEHAA